MNLNKILNYFQRNTTTIPDLLFNTNTANTIQVPKDIVIHWANNGLTLVDLTRMQCVCKNWQEVINAVLCLSFPRAMKLKEFITTVMDNHIYMKAQIRRLNEQITNPDQHYELESIPNFAIACDCSWVSRSLSDFTVDEISKQAIHLSKNSLIKSGYTVSREFVCSWIVTSKEKPKPTTPVYFLVNANTTDFIPEELTKKRDVIANYLENVILFVSYWIFFTVLASAFINVYYLCSRVCL